MLIPKINPEKLRERLEAQARVVEIIAEYALDSLQGPHVELEFPQPGPKEGSRSNANSLSVEERRTVSIGKALLKYGDEERETPDFDGSKENFKAWAGDTIKRGPSTAYTALLETGVWSNPKQGDSTGLEATLEETMAFAKEHS